MPACSAEPVPSHLMLLQGSQKTNDEEQPWGWQPGCPIVEETEDYTVTTASTSLQILTPQCFQEGISKGTISDIPTQGCAEELDDSE